MLEAALCDFASCYGVVAVTRPGLPGAWVWREAEPLKLASIGLGIRRGVTLHGCAVNLDERAERGFRDIDACGIRGVRVTSIAACTERPGPLLSEAAATLAGAFAARLGRSPEECPIASLELSSAMSPTLDDGEHGIDGPSRAVLRR
jgi:lipoate-protein ligase B